MLKLLKRSSVHTFSLMFGVIFLLNLNYTILKSVRKTLAIADLGGSATSIPIFELFGVLPAAILMTWFLSKILRNYSMKKVFLITLFIFLVFFIFFACICYPRLVLLGKFPGSAQILQFSSMSFYIMGELWKPALIQILFLGFINFNLSVEQAKGIYPSIMLGASLGAVLAGPITVICSSNSFWTLYPIANTRWEHSLILMMLVVFAVGCLTALCYTKLYAYFKSSELEYEEEKKFSLMEALNTFFNSTSLKLMGWIIFADYIAYSLAEVLFLEVLKHRFPLPADYCSYMGYLSFWHSIITIAFAIVVAPICLKKARWLSCAFILPISLLILEGAFFAFLCAENTMYSLFSLNHAEWLNISVILGSVLFCVCRAIKYTIFDPCKELAFIGMPKSSRMKGKIVIDGLCSKFGRGTSSVTTLSLVSISGGVLASAYLTSLVALTVVLSLLISTNQLGRRLEARS